MSFLSPLMFCIVLRISAGGHRVIVLCLRHRDKIARAISARTLRIGIDARTRKSPRIKTHQVHAHVVSDLIKT